MFISALQNHYYCEIISANCMTFHNLFLARHGTATVMISDGSDLMVMFKCSQKCGSLTVSKLRVSVV